MKKVLIFCFIITFALIGQPPVSKAGTFFLGVKGWYTIWDSAILNWLENDIGLSFQQNRVQFNATDDDGDGYLVGPLLGYLTDDGKWSVSFAPMIFSDFNQDWEGSASAMILSGSAKLERQDYDLAITYHYSQYIKVFAGFKYQDMKLDFTLNTTTTLGTQTDTFNVEAEAYIPSFGFGVVLPLVQEKVVVGGQAGLLFPMMNMEITNQNGTTDDILPHMSVGFNVEGNVTYQGWENIIIQAGYRYQWWEFEARGPGRTTAITSQDITHGPTLSVVYTF